MRWKYLFLVMAINLLTIFLGLSACNTPPPSETGSGKLQVVATTTIVSDILQHVGGDKIALTTLLPWGVDPHSYEPVPQDIARVSDADVIFAHGAGLEGFLQILLESASAEGKIVHVSDGIKLLQTTDLNEGDHTEDGHPEDGYESGDPHTWTDPNNVMIWVQNIQNKLSEMDPDNAGYYQENASSYLTELQNLDAWIRSEIDKIPLENRKIVTDHLLFGYFCAAYGFEQVGALVPAY
ncbi:metal ABC transporter substrate-binding protein, partial [Chloroflexota bacterium]